ncbi:hypothetical protein SAMN05216215_100866 [Saccharopolyspora shandongensis]|uniref:Uncharacterized protein n=1 Tax=Saccharopolyspora shandongensis TaxID=418495 RepID=A0A1H2ZJP4_9PSEU|nr:hypothetical protein SAMN05216215_100866 [Saccharopolyspora shandongensis]
MEIAADPTRRSRSHQAVVLFFAVWPSSAVSDCEALALPGVQDQRLIIYTAPAGALAVHTGLVG